MKGYRIVQDYDCHNYLVPADKVNDWEKWMDEDGGLTTDTPEYAFIINRVEDILILDYRLDP